MQLQVEEVQWQRLMKYTCKAKRHVHTDTHAAGRIEEREKKTKKKERRFTGESWNFCSFTSVTCKDKGKQ